MSSYLNHAALHRNRLTKWHSQNPSGRQRRTEAVEAMGAVSQYLIANDFNLESRRCARRKGLHIIAPEARLIAKEISKSPAWVDKPPLSEFRVRKILHEFAKAGYIKLSKQHRHRKANGDWLPAPKVITFTKVFFTDLGGKKLWTSILKAGQERLVSLLEQFDGNKKALGDYFKMSSILAPYQLKVKRSPP